MRPVAFGQALPAGTRLMLFSDDKPERFFTVIKFWKDETSGVALALQTGVPTYQVEDWIYQPLDPGQTPEPNPLVRDLSHPAKKRHHGQALHEDGKGNYRKADRNSFFALRDFRGQSEGESQRNRSPQSSPKQDMLMFHRDPQRGTREGKTTRIHCNRPAQRHQRNRRHGWNPDRGEILVGFLHSYQEKSASSQRKRRTPKMPGRLLFPG
jgi:hypothetical protein